MKNSHQIKIENPIGLKDFTSAEDNGEKLLEHYGWLCQVEVINEMSVNEEQKLEMLRKIKNVYPENV